VYRNLRASSALSVKSEVTIFFSDLYTHIEINELFNARSGTACD
jgi:hypothetical protein